MRRIPVWVVTFVLALVTAAPAAGQAPAADQREAGQWQFVISPYFMGASMSGTTAVAGQEMEVDLSASDIFENLKFGMMGTALARKGKWGLGFDGMWASLGATTPPDPAFTVDGEEKMMKALLAEDTLSTSRCTPTPTGSPTCCGATWTRGTRPTTGRKTEPRLRILP